MLDVDVAVAAIIADARTGRRGGDRADRKVRQAGADPDVLVLDAGDRGGMREGFGRGPAALELAASHPRLSRTPDAWRTRWTDAAGAELGWALGAGFGGGGCIKPGGLPPYPSSVLMNAIPAKVAGVWLGRLSDAGGGQSAGPAGGADFGASTPSTGSGGGDRRAGLRTETIRPVDKITARNAYVAAAKRRPRPRRHRHDRWAVGDPCHCRQRQRSRSDRAGSAEPGRTRRKRAASSRSRQRGVWPRRGRCGGHARRLETLERRAIAGASCATTAR